MESIYKITLDFQKNGYQACLDGFRRLDSGRVIKVSLVDGRNKKTFDNNPYIIVKFVLPSGEEKFIDTVTYDEDVATFTIPNVVLAEEGEVLCELTIFENEDKEAMITSAKFKLLVTDILFEDGEIAEEVADELLQYANRLQDLEDNKVDKNVVSTQFLLEGDGNGGFKASFNKDTVERNINKEIGTSLTDSTTKYPSSHTVKNYIDTADATNLASAKSYADTKKAEAIATAETLANEAYDDALEEIEAEVISRQNADATTLASAKEYTDTKVNAHKSEVNNTVAQLSTRINNEMSARASGDADTLASAKAYADTKQDKLTAGNNITIENNVISSNGESYAFENGVTENDGTVSADMDYIINELDDNYYASFNMAKYRKDEIIVGASGSNAWIQTSGKKLSDLQNKLTAGNNIKIENDVISAIGGGSSFILVTENNTTVTTDDTKGVAPYNASYGYTNITINGYDDIDLTTGLTLCILCSGSLVVASAYRNTRFRFGTSGEWIPFYATTTIANGGTFLSTNYSRIIYYSTNIISTGAFHPLTDNNTTYTPVGLGFGYGTCTTASTSTSKVVTLSNYALNAGGLVAIKFTHSVPANSTLNINSKGSKNIQYNGARITDGVIRSDMTALFIYTGSVYELLAISTDITKKQDLLFSGQNIKTINGESILGAGDLTIGGSGSPIGEVVLDQNITVEYQTGDERTSVFAILDADGNEIDLSNLESYDKFDNSLIFVQFSGAYGNVKVNLSGSTTYTPQFNKVISFNPIQVAESGFFTLSLGHYCDFYVGYNDELLQIIAGQLIGSFDHMKIILVNPMASGGSSEQVIFDEQITWGDGETGEGYYAFRMLDADGNTMTFSGKGLGQNLFGKSIMVELYLSYAPETLYFKFDGDFMNVYGFPTAIACGSLSSGGNGIVTPYLNENFYIGTEVAKGSEGIFLEQMLTSCDHMKITIK